ncbi:hypothetical protein DSECCO2_514870 [anaerobic digester metagenome]
MLLGDPPANLGPECRCRHDIHAGTGFFLEVLRQPEEVEGVLTGTELDKHVDIAALLLSPAGIRSEKDVPLDVIPSSGSVFSHGTLLFPLRKRFVFNLETLWIRDVPPGATLSVPVAPQPPERVPYRFFKDTGQNRRDRSARVSGCREVCQFSILYVMGRPCPPSRRALPLKGAHDSPCARLRQIRNVSRVS